MKSRHLVDPALLPLLDALPKLELSMSTLAARRAQELVMLATMPPVKSETIKIESLLIPGPADAPEVKALLYAPKQTSATLRPAILQIHGGGYIGGHAEQRAALSVQLAQELGAVVLAVNYRLAPETPFPGPVEDCYAGLRWLHTRAASLGVDPTRIAVAGESAGGGLAAALCLIARDRKEFSVCYQHLIFPMLDDRTCLAEPHPYVGEYVWTPEYNTFGWTALLGHAPGAPDVSPYAAPARATDLSGLPPTFLICGSLDLFIEENMEYARRLIRAGVPTEMHVYPGAPHAFMLVENLALTETYERDAMAALRKALK